MLARRFLPKNLVLNFNFIKFNTMRILYNTCVADPFVFVAEKMQKDYDYEPVYWIGYDDDGSEELVKEHLPNTKYHNWRDAWKAVFPNDIEEEIKYVNLDIDMLRSLSMYELQGIKMMDRLDNDRYSFNFMEREQFYHNLMKGWMACLNVYRPDVVISGVNPHRVYDYVLYLVCKYRGIHFLNFQHTLCEERTFCVNGNYTIGDIFDKSYVAALNNTRLSPEDLAPEIKAQFDKVVKSYKEAAPQYMAVHKVNHKKYSNWFYLIGKGITTYSFFGKDKVKVKGDFSLKKRGTELKDAHFSLVETAEMMRKAQKYKNELNKLYSSLTSTPVDGEKYVLFPLHFQPEETTSPSGDIFVNQILVVETLLKNTPETYMIYVKEHPQQLQSHTAGHKSRIKDYYTYLSKLPRVKLMPLELNSYQLMKNATAVATITGTVGWEALMHHIPVIIFGFIWYEKMPGVLRVTDSASASRIMQFIADYKYDEHKVVSYLKAFEENTVYAYHYLDQKATMNMKTEDCAAILSQYIFKRVEYIYKQEL